MLIRLIIFSLFCFFLTFIPVNFLKLNYFNLTKITISENSKILHRELTNLTKNLYNKNNFDIDYKELKKIFKKDIRVEDVEINEIALGEIEINIKEKDFLYYASIKNEIYLVDEKGRLFGYMAEKRKESSPVIVAKTSEEVEEITELLNKISKLILYDYVSQVYKKTDDEYRMVLVDGIEVKTNFEVDEKRYKILEILYSDMRKKQKIEYIDIRFDDYIIKYLEAGKNGN